MKKLDDIPSGSARYVPSAVDRRPVLYIEDEPVNWEITQLRLRRQYELHWARTDQEACAWLALHHREVYAILMDIQLKGSRLDGIQLTRLLRGKSLPQVPEYARAMPVLSVPIIFVTAYEARYTEDQIMAAGGTYIVTKPVDFDVLSLVLANAHTYRTLQKSAP